MPFRRFLVKSLTVNKNFHEKLLKTSVADKPDSIDALRDNIREVIGEIQLHTIDNVIKNWADRLGYCMASRARHLKEGLYFEKNFFLNIQ